MLCSRQIIQGRFEQRQRSYNGHWVINAIMEALSQNLNIQSVYFDEQNSMVRQYIFDFDPQKIIRVVEMKRYTERNPSNPIRFERTLGGGFQHYRGGDEEILIGQCDEAGVLVASFSGALDFIKKEIESYTEFYAESSEILARDRAVIELTEASLPPEMQKDIKNRIKNNQVVPKTDELIDLVKKNAPTHLQWLVKEITE